MLTKTENGMHVSFWDVYKKNISPTLCEIDLFLKMKKEPYSVKSVTKVLNITDDEIKFIMNQEKIKKITMEIFFKIMEKGSSDICRLYKREVECGRPVTYTRDHISYIYNIDLKIVNEVCDSLNIVEATSFTLPILFANIPALSTHKKCHM